MLRVAFFFPSAPAECAGEGERRKALGSIADDLFGQGLWRRISRTMFAEVSRYGRRSPNAAAGFGGGVFYSWPGHDLGGDFSTPAAKNQDLRHARVF